AMADDEVEKVTELPAGEGVPRPPVRRRRLALGFLTSAARAPAPDKGPSSTSAAIWNESAWSWLAEDFVQTTSEPLEACFNLLCHDDSAGAAAAEGSFTAKLRGVATVPTHRAELSLVFAELSLIRAALEDPDTQAMLLLSGSCLPLLRLSELYTACLEGECYGKSILKYHFMKGGQQRVLGVPLGALQWKLWHRRELQQLAALEEANLRRRWEPLEATMQRYGLAPDEVVLVNELREELLKSDPTCKDPFALCCIRRATTYTEWEAKVDKHSGPPRARIFPEIPEKAWPTNADCGEVARDIQSRDSPTPLLCRKIYLGLEALQSWKKRLTGGAAEAQSATAICLAED
ncbi:unnamed protein product, partial [Symbiodinium pilosum]